MAALTHWADYASRLHAPSELIGSTKVATTTIAGRTYDYWVPATLGGTAPTTAAAPTRATTGALGQQNGGTEALYLLGARLASSQAGTFILCDRLSHQGGLSGTTTGAQTTNLPTAALTRYTTGAGVWMAASIYTQVGTTATTITATYTNQAGTGSRVSPTVVFGATGNREANRLILLPLQSGDSGVRSVESVTIAATTGTAGAFGVTLFKPLVSFHVDRPGGQVDFSLVDGGMQGGLPEVLDDACLFWVVSSASTSTALVGALSCSTV